MNAGPGRRSCAGPTQVAFNFSYTYRAVSADAFAVACTVMNGEVRHHHIDIESAEDDEDISDDALEDALDST